MNQVYIVTPYLTSILMLYSYLWKGFQRYLIALLRATCPVHLTLLDDITKITFYEEYKL